MNIEITGEDKSFHFQNTEAALEGYLFHVCGPILPRDGLNTKAMKKSM